MCLEKDVVAMEKYYMCMQHVDIKIVVVCDDDDQHMEALKMAEK